MLTAVYAARNIVGEKNDVWSVNTEMEYHEEVRQSSTKGDRLTPQRVAPPETAEKVIEAAFAKLDPLAMGVALGVVASLVLFLATTVLLLKGGPVVGPTLGLLDNFFLGYSVTWSGAFWGLAQAAFGGFALGFLFAWLRNWSLTAYAFLVQRSAEAKARGDLLDKV